jgi:hypothetical protein
VLLGHGEEHQLEKRASWRIFFATALGLLMLIGSTQKAQALELDWSGQFWAEFNYVNNYSQDYSSNGATYDPARGAAGGYYTPGGGSGDAIFGNLFLRLRPKVIVNDNIFIKSEWWLGDPVFGLFGSGVPYSLDRHEYYSNQSRGSVISAQRLWGEFLTDIGTFQVGRVPLQWGLGLVWNSGDALWSRYMSTGDAIRWIAKFGSFSFIPSFILNSAGNSIGGSCNVSSSGVCTPGMGLGGVQDYSLIVKYENTEDELEIGANIVKRLAGSNQDQNAGLLTPQPGNPLGPLTTIPASSAGSMNYLTYDIYARKKFSRLTLGVEVPIAIGNIGSSNYQAFAAAAEVNYQAFDPVELMLKLGYASGQTNVSGAQIDTYRAFYMNPDYHIGMIMFNYQLSNFARAQTLNNPAMAQSQLSSPYDNPIVNAGYIALSSNIKPWDKWTFRPGLVYARAPQVSTNGSYFYNYTTKTLQQNNTGSDQGANLGFEFDLGVTFQWDEYFQFSLDNGIYLPGNFYAFSNTTNPNATAPVFASSLRIGVNF